MSLLHLAILLPLLVSLFIPLLYKKIRSVHTGWFVLLVPLTLVIYFSQFISQTMAGKPVTATMNWIPSLGINFVAYVDGLGLLFALLITGIGSLVVLYSVYYLDPKKRRCIIFMSICFSS